MSHTELVCLNEWRYGAVDKLQEHLMCSIKGIFTLT